MYDISSNAKHNCATWLEDQKLMVKKVRTWERMAQRQIQCSLGSLSGCKEHKSRLFAALYQLVVAIWYFLLHSERGCHKLHFLSLTTRQEVERFKRKGAPTKYPPLCYHTIHFFFEKCLQGINETLKGVFVKPIKLLTLDKCWNQEKANFYSGMLVAPK